MEPIFKEELSLQKLIPTLEIIYDRFVRMFRITLSGALRKPVDVSVRSIEALRFGEFLKQIPVPSSLNLFRADPLRGTAIMILETRLVFNLVDIFYGGTGELEVKAEGRDFTPIEQRLVKRVMISALEDLQVAWRPFFKLQLAYQRTEINPLFVAIVPQTETVVVTNFDVEMGKDPLHITLCIPYSMLQPLALYFKAKEVLASPLIQNIRGILDVGYRSTPLPSLVQKVTGQVKQSFGKDKPVQVPRTEVETSRPPSEGTLISLIGIEPKIVASHIRNEHPQTIALILAHVDAPEHTAQILKQLPQNLQADVTYRVAIMGSIPPGVVTEIEAVLFKEFRASGATKAKKMGGVESVAEILNTLDSSTESQILKTIATVNPDLATQIRELMFTFADLVLVDSTGMQTILKEIPHNDLALALKSGSDAVKEHIFCNLSEQAAEVVRKDLDALGSVRLADAELAQQKLVKVARKLEEEGRIIINGIGADVIVDKKKKKTTRKKVTKKTPAKKTTRKSKS